MADKKTIPASHGMNRSRRMINDASVIALRMIMLLTKFVSCDWMMRSMKEAAFSYCLTLGLRSEVIV